MKSQRTAKEYWEEYFKAVKSGEGRHAFAKRMGIKASTVYHKTVKKLNQGYEVPHLVAEKYHPNRDAFEEVMKANGFNPAKGRVAPKKPIKVAAPRKPMLQQPQLVVDVGEPEVDVSEVVNTPEDASKVAESVNVELSELIKQLMGG